MYFLNAYTTLLINNNNFKDHFILSVNYNKFSYFFFFFLTLYLQIIQKIFECIQDPSLPYLNLILSDYEVRLSASNHSL